jgi:hypothetical protein
MIFTLLIMSLAQKESVQIWAEGKVLIKALLNMFSGMAPSALGKPYQPD